MSYSLPNTCFCYFYSNVYIHELQTPLSLTLRTVFSATVVPC